MDIINKAADQYRQSLQTQAPPPDPLAQLAGQVGLRVNSPEAEQKLRIMGDVISQQSAQSAQAQQAGATQKALFRYKQSFFGGIKAFGG